MKKDLSVPSGMPRSVVRDHRQRGAVGTRPNPRVWRPALAVLLICVVGCSAKIEEGSLENTNDSDLLDASRMSTSLEKLRNSYEERLIEASFMAGAAEALALYKSGTLTNASQIVDAAKKFLKENCH